MRGVFFSLPISCRKVFFSLRGAVFALTSKIFFRFAHGACAFYCFDKRKLQKEQELSFVFALRACVCVFCSLKCDPQKENNAIPQKNKAEKQNLYRFALCGRHFFIFWQMQSLTKKSSASRLVCVCFLRNASRNSLLLNASLKKNSQVKIFSDYAFCEMRSKNIKVNREASLVASNAFASSVYELKT